MNNNIKKGLVFGGIVAVGLGGVLLLSNMGSNSNEAPIDKPMATTTPSENPMSENKEGNFASQDSDLMNYTTLMSDEKFESINAEKLLSYIGNPDADQVIYIGTPYCSHCLEAAPVIQNKANEYQVDVQYISIDELSEEEYDQILAAIDPIATVVDEETGTKDIVMPHVFSIVDGEMSEDLSETGYTPDVTDYSEIFASVSKVK